MPDISVSPKVDPITKILTKQAPNIRDVGKALLRASTGKTTYGEALNTMRARELNEAKVLHSITTTNRRLDQKDQEIALRARTIDINQAAQAAQNDPDRRFVDTIAKLFPKGDAGQIVGAMHELPYDLSRVGLRERLTLAKKVEAHLRKNKKLHSQQSKAKEYAPSYKNIAYPDGRTEVIDTSDRNAMERARKAGGVLSGKGGLAIEFGPGGQLKSIQTSKPYQRARAKTEANLDDPLDATVARLAGLPPGTTNRDAAGAGVSYDVPGSRLKDLTNTKANSDIAVRLGSQLRYLLKENPDIRGAPATISRLADNLKSQTIGLLKVLGYQVTAPQSTGAYSATFQKLAITDGRMQSLILDLAFAEAGAREGGKLTERDIERALTTLGTQLKAGASMERVLTDYIERVDTRYQAKIRSALGRVSGSMREEVDRTIIQKAIQSGTLSEAERRSLSPLGLEKLIRLLEEQRSAGSS